MLFRGKHDIAYLKRLNREVVERVVGEKITYYAMSKKFTSANFYGEAKEKVFEPPVEIYTLVEWQDQDIKTDKFGQDVAYKIAFYPLLETVTEKNLSPREGDFIEYDEKFFEISNISYPTQMLGKESESFYLKIDCVTTREGVFRTETSGTAEDATRTRPDDRLTSSFSYDDVIFPFSSSY